MNRFRNFCLTALVVLCSVAAQARDGYSIRLHYTDLKETTILLAKYFGKGLPTIYKVDSVRLNAKGEGTLTSSEKIVGGIYLLLPSDMRSFNEVLLNNGDDFSVEINSSVSPNTISFKNTVENDRFQEYQRYLIDFSTRQEGFKTQLAAARTKKDSTAVTEKRQEMGKELVAYRRSLVQKYPGSLIASVLSALEVPEIPPAPKDAKGKIDSTFAYRYLKAHYWDGFNFKDERLIHTPIYDAKLDEYFNNLVVPSPDSVTKEADWILGETRGQTQLFNYTLSWITQFAERSKIMGMDAAFVHMVEKYYARGDATWLPDSTVQKYLDRIAKIGPNMIGKIAPDLDMQTMDGKTVKLSDVKAKYTVLLFYSPDCGHCITEVPKLDSMYRAVLKGKGAKVFAVRTEGSEQQWKDFVAKNKIQDWINVWDPGYTSAFRSKYDVYSTPVIYLLDDKKIIRGKRLDYSTIPKVMEMLERKSLGAR
jgi:peroxiredoxin